MNKQYLVYLALGTNMGNRANNLHEALAKLPSQVTVLAVSRLYETAPAYLLKQPAFLNIAIKGQTVLSPPDLLTFIKQIENQIGRKKTVRYGPRKIDLDIIFYEKLIINEVDLQIPHPRMEERAFVLHPLLDIAPDFVHPVLKKTVSQLVADLPIDDGIWGVSDLVSELLK